MNAAQIKFLVSLAIILALWRVFEIPGVATAFWALITVGAIPGSTTVLGSDTMLRILCILFAVCFFLIFRKEFFASLPRRHPRKQPEEQPHPEPTPVASAVPSVPSSQPNPLQQTVIVLSKQKDRPGLAPVRPAFVALGYLAAAIVRAVTVMESYTERYMRIAAAVIGRAARWTWQYVKTFGRIVYRYTHILLRVIARVAVLAWQASEPYIRTFDKWLEAQLHANKRTAQVLRISNDIGKTAAGVYRQTQDTARKLLADK